MAPFVCKGKGLCAAYTLVINIGGGHVLRSTEMSVSALHRHE